MGACVLCNQRRFFCPNQARRPNQVYLLLHYAGRRNIDGISFNVFDELTGFIFATYLAKEQLLYAGFRWSNDIYIIHPCRRSTEVYGRLETGGLEYGNTQRILHDGGAHLFVRAGIGEAE